MAGRHAAIGPTVCCHWRQTVGRLLCMIIMMILSAIIFIYLLFIAADNELQTVASMILPGYRVSSDAKDDTFSHKFLFKVCKLF